ncbi:radical SAM protein [Paramaledivibacter caminithermalis]|jgi:hypothetical protein|uniref:Elp3/MiaA/NifB-like radical SAM core domain-containing protein n=1 Tax=Paramaledivibacter caminithermalis (strain DSM 15212 / CIP 107654 / DViRD3) TaxID=1121301 RepID=A0A1M6QGM5_PARC5|nr:radical SAM protein [Paramaledivibacter caminithermalis]SHK19223.1 hypothetical protein SAMN02745912_02564 [Paramaledivibacter caminithermalis DSM 15212]
MTHNIFDYFKKYENVPNGAIVKEDMLRLGVSFAPEVFEHVDGYLLKNYNLFASNYDRANTGEMVVKNIPAEIRISSSKNKILPTIVETRYSAISPYKITYDQKGFKLLFKEREIAEVEFCKRPKYHNKQFKDGIKYKDVVALVHWGYKIAISVVRVCSFNKNDICKYCDINTNLKFRTDSNKLNIDPLAKLEYVVPVVKEILENEQIEGSRTLVYGLTGGTMLKNGKSIEADIYSHYIKKLKAEVGGRYPVSVTCTAQNEDDLWKLKEAGLDVYQCNIEVWDKQIFHKVCPGKSKLVGHDKWVELLKKAVDIFGEGNVITNFVAGVEYSKAYGFSTMEEAIQSTTDGFEYLMYHGITPKMTSFCASAGSSLRNEPIIPLDYYVQIAMNWYNLWRKYLLPPVRNHGPMGPGRAIEINSTYNDIGS